MLSTRITRLAHFLDCLAIVGAYADPRALKRLGRKRLSMLLIRTSRGHSREEKADQLLAAADETLRLWAAGGVDFAELADDIAAEVRIIKSLDAELATIEDRIAALYEEADPKGIVQSAPGLGVTLAAGILGRTGDLNRFANLSGVRSFTGELVSFSALTTLRHAGIEAVAMVEEGSRITAWWFAAAYPRLIGVPIKLETRIRQIQGDTRVSGVVLESADGTVERLACDGVVFTGGYVPDSVLIRNSRLAVTPQLLAPVIDQTWRCSDPNVFAAGNVLRPIETAAWAFREGKAAGEAIARSLDGEEAVGRLIPIDWAAPIRLVTPQRIRWPGPPLSTLHLKLRMEREARGLLCVLVDNELVWSRRLHALPERRISLPRRLPIAQAAAVRVEFRE